MFSKQEIRNGLQKIQEDIQKNWNSGDISIIQEIRKKIIVLLEDSISFYLQEDLLDIWVRVCLSKAMHELYMNLEKSEVTLSWLSACLSAIELSTTDKGQRSPQSYSPNKEEESLLKSTDFLKEVRKLKAKI